MALSSSQIYVATYNASAPKTNVSGGARIPLQETTSTSRWRFGRSTTSLREAESRTSSIASPVPTVPKIERSASKMSLFNLFSKPKVEKARGHTEVGLAVPMRPQSPPKPAPVVSAPKSSLRHNPSPSAQQSIRSRSSQIFRPMSMRPLPPPSSKEAKEFGSWEPPPLFQAFPQSVKHATVQACVFAPEVLMRTQSQRRQAEMLRERIDSARDLSIITEDGADARHKLEKSHRRLISNSVLNPPAPELVNKIYILVTSGFVLQYAGDGSFDRTPEKVLKLGKDSAAFACDLIPGKHWVLQISSHALDDGTSEAGPRNSLLSRLRSQNAITRKAATSFLLVLDSAEEMDAWMTVVRKEIDNQGGNRLEVSRASSSTDDTRDARSIDTTSHRYHVQRDPSAPSKIGPVDSPLQSQYSSPRVFASEWESGQSDRAPSIAESSSGQSYRLGNHRQSTDTLSTATTPVSQDQSQLDSLRSRSRFSYMSNSSVSGPGTRNTSRDSSPAPKSPLQDKLSPAVEHDTLRSAMSLKSFHMNPSNSVTSRRRSMQPLPVTKEHFVPSMERPVLFQRHSLYGPASPTMLDDAQSTTTNSIAAVELSGGQQIEKERHIPSSSTTATSPRSLHSYTRQAPLTDAPTQAPSLVDSPAQPRARSYSQARRDVVSPPPSGPAPTPPVSAPRQSMLVEQPRFSLALVSAQPQDVKTQRRGSSNPKPFLRPIPVRPQQQHADQSKVNPRRLSSLASPPSRAPSRSSVIRSVTAPVRSSPATNPGPTSHPNMLDANGQPVQSRRPISVQTRTSPAPFLLSAARPVRPVASTPSFVPGSRRTSNPQLNAPDVQSTQEQVLRPELKLVAPRRSMGSFGLVSSEQMLVAPRRSMTGFGLPPPAPPPNMPLPTLPPNLPLTPPPPPPSMPLPPTPPNMPLPPVPAATMSCPGPPPNMPLPKVPGTVIEP